MRKSVVYLPFIYNVSVFEIEKGEPKERKKCQEKEQTQKHSQNNNERENSLNTLLIPQAAMTLN
jgi:hypothetical protein